MNKQTSYKTFIAIAGYLCSAEFIYAASGDLPSSALLNSNSTLSTLINSLLALLNSLVPLLVGGAVVFFLYGVFVFIAKSSMGNSEGRAEGIKFMIFGIIGIAVMVSVWGLVGFVTNTFGTTTAVPQFNTTGTPASQANFPSINPNSPATSQTLPNATFGQ